MSSQQTVPQIICDETFWCQKAKRLLNISRSRFCGGVFPPNERYLQLASHMGFDISKRSEKYFRNNRFATKAIRTGNYKLLQDILVYQSRIDDIMKAAVVKFEGKPIMLLS